ncbi:MAG: alanine--tRNA ligase [Deltaproteobacteria bacterium]|nr:MAG: alanine--tRNA ligase [Deltaproteobacteria bacterium]
MKGNEIRTKFIEYFKKNGHSVVESSSLVPQDDPTLLFTNAGMVQFKKVFMGGDQRDYVRAVSSQKCVRAGGKHNDLENVGYTARHHTFFEMLGNFSFGDYFKEDAIRYAWEFLTKELGLPPEKLWVSVYEEDDEAYELWEKIEDLPKGRIVRLGEKDNFWAMGDTGPCGPCSEIHIDQGEGSSPCDNPNCAVGCDCDRYLELWNLVFMQFERSTDGTMTRLPKPSIDTGMGLERMAAVLQGKFNNFDSDLFTPIIAVLEEMSGRSYNAEKRDDIAMRVIADHARATAFLVADGVLPSNEGRGYVLRRIMRRAVRYGKNLGLDQPFMSRVIRAVIDEMGGAYKQLPDAAELLEKVVENEEERFRETLEHGLALLDEEIARLGVGQAISGQFIFKLYDTYGFPFDIVRDIALEKGLDFDEAGFQAAMENQRSTSRASRKGEGVKLLADGVQQIIENNDKNDFVGYDKLAVETVVVALLDVEGHLAEVLAAGDKGKLFVPVTPFYAESGGQGGDKGYVVWDGGSGLITDTRPLGDGYTFHDIMVEAGELKPGTVVEMEVASGGRLGSAANHTATHLLQAALVKVLGEHVKQAGSLVEPRRLRFDFTHFSPVSQEEITEVERLVNEQIRANTVLTVRYLDKEEAIEQGATALFGEKYDDRVRVVQAGDFSMELCGGTHVRATGDIGVFKVLSEGGVASGVRRIEALAGQAAFEILQEQSARQTALETILNVKGDELQTKVEGLLRHQKELEKQIAELSAQLAGAELDSLLKNYQEAAGIKVVAAEIPLDSPKTLREVGDKVRDNLDSGVAVLGGVIKGKVALLALVSKDLTGKIKAGDVVSQVAAVVGGKGGGRPDMAQAGGTMTDKLPEAIGKVKEIVAALAG